MPDLAAEAIWQDRVTQYAADYLNTLFGSDMFPGIARGKTLSKRAFWREWSMQRLRNLREKADFLFNNIGVVNASIPSQAYSGSYQEESDYLSRK